MWKINGNFENENLPSYTVSSSDNVIIGNEARSAVETTLVHEPRHPRVFIRGCRPSTDDSILLIRYTAFWKQFLHHCCPLRDIVARGAGSTRRRFLPWTVTSIASHTRNHTYWLTLLHMADVVKCKFRHVM